MKIKYNKSRFFFIILVLFLFISQIIIAQSFERIETIAGLGVLEENNGVAVADYDGDKDLDIFVVAIAKDENGNEISHSRLFKNNNDGTFQDVTLEAGLNNLFPISEEGDDFFGLAGIKHGVSWGDYDNDGFPDLFFTHSFKIQLFHNEGNGTFVEKTTEAGFQRTNTCRNTGATWFDLNNDGFLDIYISEWGNCLNNSLYLNNGNGTFQNVTEQFGRENLIRFSYMSLPFDFNEDGYYDLYVTNDFREPNDLFINENGTSFSEQAQNYGVGNPGDDMGIAMGDYNNDGFFDMFITNINENVLLMNNGDNTFVNIAIDENLRDTGWAWDTSFSDFDLDGDEDLFVVNGFKLLKNDGEYNMYFKNLLKEGQDSFSDFSEQVNLNDLTTSVGAAIFDFDNDGDLDIFVTNSDRPSYFYKNNIIDVSQGANLKWLKVSLEGTVSNRNAIGTKISLTTDDGTLNRYYTGLGFLSQSIQPVHFGLGTASQINELKITWPSGLVETYDNLTSNTTIYAVEGEGYEVSGIIYGCTDPNSCNYNPDAVINDGTCTYLESGQIVGNNNPGFLTTEIYSYPFSENSTYHWEVLGGEIIEGQGTSSIKVKWELEETGKISVLETNLQCSSNLVEIGINLSIATISENQSIARLWNEALLVAIRGDYARPTVHARNLFHTGIAMYDAWAIYDDDAKTYLIGKNVHDYINVFDGFLPSESLEESRNKTISYAAYRLLKYRFRNSPGVVHSTRIFDLLMNQLGYDTSFTSTDYSAGNGAALGNFIAESIISYGFTDGARESSDYDNAHYEPINPPLAPVFPGNDDLLDPNRWQPLSLEIFIDQSGNVIEGTVPEFLSPEWGDVSPFALSASSKVNYQRSGNTYSVFHDPKEPPYLDTTAVTLSSEAYKWGFSMVSIWGAHLDPYDNTMWDISPNSIGNVEISELPENHNDLPNFYNLLEGGDIGNGHGINPHTQSAYTPQIVPRGDYTRVLAEFWADGPDSETPPGHWFTILNYVNDNELFERKFNGTGDELNPLEWDVKAYFILGGAMHDAAISSWSIKGWYDYIRPISAIRFMAGKGQSSDATKDNFDLAGIPLREGFIEIVETGDPLSGENGEHIGKIKLFTWRGHDYIEDTNVDEAGVGWILAENWWPYQRPTFVTPPFAGYVSGHSTYSRAAAEVMTLFTGDEYFPGGLGEFVAKKNEFLVFEEGPSVDVKLQWATYRDASDQCSLSRIWGGIHPPADDIPGRLIGEKIGKDAFSYGAEYFYGKLDAPSGLENSIIYPNPITNGEVFISNTTDADEFNLYDIQGRKLRIGSKIFDISTKVTRFVISSSITPGFYILKSKNQSKLVIIER